MLAHRCYPKSNSTPIALYRSTAACSAASSSRTTIGDRVRSPVLIVALCRHCEQAVVAPTCPQFGQLIRVIMVARRGLQRILPALTERPIYRAFTAGYQVMQHLQFHKTLISPLPSGPRRSWCGPVTPVSHGLSNDFAEPEPDVGNDGQDDLRCKPSCCLGLSPIAFSSVSGSLRDGTGDDHVVTPREI